MTGFVVNAGIMRSMNILLDYDDDDNDDDDDDDDDDERRKRIVMKIH